MRALWSGSLSFGLINIPVRLYSGVEGHHQLDLHMLHKDDLSPIRYARICTNDGQEIPYEDIVKGYEWQPGEFVVISDEEFAEASVEKSNTIDIKQFTNESEIDIRYFEKPYYLEPAKGAEKAYALLREALAGSDKIAVCTYVMRNRQHLAAIKPVGDVLVLDQMRFADEVGQPSGLKLPSSEETDEKELEIARKLVEELTEGFDPERFHDTYQEDLGKIIQQRIEGAAPSEKGKRKLETPSRDLMQALKESLEAAVKSKAS